MQLATDSALATYLASTHCVFQHRLIVDWAGNGLFTHAYSDLSTLFDSITIKRDLTGNIPDDFIVTEGYSIGELTVTFSGRIAANILELDELLQPWNKNSPLYGKTIIGVGLIYEIIVPVSGSPRTLRQFVGIVRSIDPDLDGTVSLTALDLLSLVRQPIIMRPIALDYSYMVFNTYTAAQQKFNLTWAIDQVLRQCGLYQSPAAILNTATTSGYFCATLNGSWFPESYSIANYVGIDSILSGADPAYIVGKYGYAANGTVNGYGQYRYTVDPKATWAKGETHQIGGWVYAPLASIASGTFTVMCAVSFSGDLDLAGRCQLELRVSTAGVVTANLVQLTGQAYNVTFTGPTIAVLDWHYVAVGIQWKLSDSTVIATFNVDGSITTVTSATVLNAFTSLQNYSSVRIQSKMPVQSIQWWKTISGTLTWPKDPPSLYGVSPQASLDLALSYISQIPDIYLEDGASTLNAMLSAELGALVSRETGEIVFWNRESIKKGYTSTNRIYLDNDSLAAFRVHQRQDAYANFITAGNNVYVLLGAAVYKSATAQAFDTPPNSTRSVIVPLKDTYRVTSASITFTNPWNASVLNGFFVTRISDGTIPAGVTVNVVVLDQRNLQVNVVNTSVDYVRLATADGTPALNVPGYQLFKLSENTTTYVDTGSIAVLKYKAYELSANAWRTDSVSVDRVARSLLNDVAYPQPVVDSVTIRCDPRVQLNDVAVCNTDHLGKIVTNIIGYTRKITQYAHPEDTLTLSALAPPGYWLLGEVGYSELGTTTKLF